MGVTLPDPNPGHHGLSSVVTDPFPNRYVYIRT